MTAAKKKSTKPIEESRERLIKDWRRAFERHKQRLATLGHTADRYEKMAATEHYRLTWQMDIMLDSLKANMPNPEEFIKELEEGFIKELEERFKKNGK